MSETGPGNEQPPLTIDELQTRKLLKQLKAESERDPNFVENSMRRIREMDREAEETTAALGLPPEAKYDVMYLMSVTGNRIDPTDHKVIPFRPKTEGTESSDGSDNT